MPLLDECYKHLWDRIIINFDGTILLCCYNTEKHFCSELGFDNIIDKLNHSSIKSMRKNLLNNDIESIITEDSPCVTSCYVFRQNNIETLKKENLISRDNFLKNHIYDNDSTVESLSVVKVENITNICVELNSHCQLRCPGCWRNSFNSVKALGLGMITVDNFIKLLDQLPYLKTIEITLNGESLLHPQFAQIIDICRERKVIPTCQIGLNFNYLTKESAEALVRAQCSDVICSIDGASQETYSRYRVGGDFNKVIKNIKLLNHYKNLYKSNKPTLYWKMIIFNWNIHELDKAQKMAKELEMEFFISHNTKIRLDVLTPENQAIFDNFEGFKVNITRMAYKSRRDRK